MSIREKRSLAEEKFQRSRWTQYRFVAVLKHVAEPGRVAAAQRASLNESNNETQFRGCTFVQMFALRAYAFVIAYYELPLFAR